MGKKILLAEIFMRSILPPFYSFSMIERICKKKLIKKPNNKDVLWFLANLYANYKQFKKAINLLESIPENGKKSRSLTLLLARAYYNLDQFEKVKELLTPKEVLFPKDHEHYYLGDSLIHLKEFEAAIYVLNNYVIYHKDSYVPFVRLGYAYYMKGSYDLALKHYKMAMSLEPKNEEIWKSIEMCKEKAGNFGDTL